MTKCLALILTLVMLSAMALNFSFALEVTEEIYAKEKDIPFHEAYKNIGNYVKIHADLNKGNDSDGIVISYFSDGMCMDFSSVKAIQHIYVEGGNQGGTLYTFDEGVYNNSGLGGFPPPREIDKKTGLPLEFRPTIKSITFYFVNE